MIIDPCGCVWRGNPRDGYDLTTCVVHWLADMFELVRSAALVCVLSARAGDAGA